MSIQEEKFRKFETKVSDKINETSKLKKKKPSLLRTNSTEIFRTRQIKRSLERSCLVAGDTCRKAIIKLTTQFKLELFRLFDIYKTFGYLPSMAT